MLDSLVTPLVMEVPPIQRHSFLPLKRGKSLD